MTEKEKDTGAANERVAEEAPLKLEICAFSSYIC